MKNNAMSLKAIINNIAKSNKVSAQSVLQTYMLERLLERISASKYKNNFILKGGMLVSAMLGIDSRTTMDMDTTIKGFKLSEEKLKSILTEICEVKLDDNVVFDIKNIEMIRENDDYGGYRVTFCATFDDMPVILKIDVTTGDKITYKEIKYSFKLLLEDRKIEVWSYNLETLLAEKYETIIKRGVFTTRIRDFYDVHMLINTQSKNINIKVLNDAIIETAIYRKTIETLKNNRLEVLEEIKNSDKLKKLWEGYKKDNFYAENIKYEDLMITLEELSKKIDI